MTTESSEWRPTVRQQKLAECLATGMQLTKACTEANVPYRTGQNWYQSPGKPEFIALVREISREATEAYREKFAMVMNAAMEQELLVLHGVADADAPISKFAHDVLSKTAYRTASVVPAKPNAAPPARRWPSS